MQAPFTEINALTVLKQGFFALTFGIHLTLPWFLAANFFNRVGVSLNKGNRLHSQNAGFESITGVETAFDSSTTGLAVSDGVALVAFHGSRHGFT